MNPVEMGFLTAAQLHEAMTIQLKEKHNEIQNRFL
jgi:hypothetical protein